MRGSYTLMYCVAVSLQPIVLSIINDVCMLSPMSEASNPGISTGSVRGFIFCFLFFTVATACEIGVCCLGFVVFCFLFLVFCSLFLVLCLLFFVLCSGFFPSTGSG